MEHLIGWRKTDDWGSRSSIPEFLSEAPNNHPLSEVWFGGHADGPTRIVAGEPGRVGLVPDHNDDDPARSHDPATPATPGETLAEWIRRDPKAALGKGILYSFGPDLPFLMKLIAPASTLSLQVHPTKEIAREGYLREDVLGLARSDPRRTYKDMNHKPEMVYALTDFEALVGFRVPRKARELLDGLDTPLADSLRRRLNLSTVRGGLRSLTAWLFDEDSTATRDAIIEFSEQCAARLDAGTSPSPRTDHLVRTLAQDHPGDPGIIVAFLMNPVSLRAGEAVYIPPRQIHSYQSGLGVEVMAASDNVVRAGLTHKYVDAAQMVEIAEFSALPPVRVAPEHPTATTDRFLVPAQEFNLSVTRLAGGAQGEGRVVVPGEGPRIVLGVDGVVTIQAHGDQGAPERVTSSLTLRRGQAVFVPASDRVMTAEALGDTPARLIQCGVP